MNEIQRIIQAAVDREHEIQRKRVWLAFFASLALVITLAAVLDRMWFLSGLTRWSGWLVGLTVAAWMAWRAAGSGGASASTIAHQVEAAAVENAPVVTTSIDPAVRRTAGGEPLAEALLERLDQQAAKAIRTAPPTFAGRLRAPVAFTAVAAAALVALVAIQGGQGLLRILVPWSSSPYTSLTLQAPDETFAEGEAFTLTANVSGVPVEKVSLYKNGSTELLAEATPDEYGMVQLRIDGLRKPAEFVVRGGDGTSKPLRIEPYSLPQIEAFEITVKPPGYGAHTASIKTEPSFSVFRGSRLLYRIHLKAPALSVAVERSAAAREDERLTDAERNTLKRGAYGVLVGSDEKNTAIPDVPTFRPDPNDPLVWEAEWDLPAPANIVYRLAVTGDRGDHVRNDEPWRINVLSDTPPVVRIESHNGDEVIKAGNETVQFDLSAVDDVRLAAARLVFRKPGQPHTRHEIPLPTETRRTWSGAELLDLAPLDLGMFDIVAVHFEAEDANAIDGPGVGRSEVVYLEVPPPESDEDDSGGGGGGAGPPPINPLELQMEILRATMVLPSGAPRNEQESLAYDQQENAGFTGQLERAVISAGLFELAKALGKARQSMESAARLLTTQPPVEAVPDEEAALGFLIESAKLLEDSKDQLPQAGDGEGQQSFTLRRPKGGSSTPEEGQEDTKNGRENLRKLMQEVQRQLAGQQALNQAAGNGGQLADSQQALAAEARSAAGRARGIMASASGSGDPRAAAEELERAAALQDDNAEALAGGDAETSAQLGAQSAEALGEALRELAAQLDSRLFGSEATASGYETMIKDYLRSISYE
ncbi:MAG: hypothetical protein P8J87_01240 [Verrucomicrobiales bacterium]|nr:hypothetical protein [Verrucomicrobiales bacterium]